MADDTQVSSRDFAADGDMPGVLESVFKKLLQKTDGMLPAVVNSYDRRNNVATVKPLIMILGTEGATTPRPSYAKIPVLAHGGGGFYQQFPIKRGDFGWIEASDRDISLFIQTEREAKPNTLRLHKFSDARFIPDVFKKYTYDEADAENFVISSLAGDIKISVGPSGIKLITDSGNESITMGAGKISIKAPTIELIDGSGTVITSSGGVVTINGIPWNSHKHGGVQTGLGLSGGPQA